MKSLVVLAVCVVFCQAAIFNNVPYGRGCKFPNWKCYCKVVYNCDRVGGFPDYEKVDDPTMSGIIKDLAPYDYALEITGKRWRRNRWSREKFCKQECNDRMNAFLCLDEEGDLTFYSYAAVCLKLLGLGTAANQDGPFNQDGGATGEPCCEVYLEWGLDWCPQTWHKLVGTTHCLTNSDLSVTSTSNAAGTYFFTAESGCAADGVQTNWCDAPGCDSVDK